MRLGKAEWDAWVKRIRKAKSDLQSTVMDRAVFQGFSDVVRENQAWIAEHEGGRFCNFVLRAYVARVALGVRRHRRVSRYSQRDDSGGLAEGLQRPAPEAAVILALPRACRRARIPPSPAAPSAVDGTSLPGCSRWDVFALARSKKPDTFPRGSASGSGDWPGLQNRWRALRGVLGGFDSHALPPPKT